MRILAAIAILYTLPGVPVIAWLVPLHVIPLSLAISNLLLTPYEESVQRGFWEEAHGKLKSLRPTIVGITGSYGKTSTKHLLGHILEIQAATLITPGSVNTPMGIARIVREQLGPHHRSFFVCEMGAVDGPGSIARLCRLAPPGFGVITAIGMAHYERFKTLETVAESKFELAQAVAKADGTVIVHEQAMGFPAAEHFAQRHSCNLQIVGESSEAAVRILSSIAITANGIAAEVQWHGEVYSLRAPIFGRASHWADGSRVRYCLRVGRVPTRCCALALTSTPQINHRLEIKEGIAQSLLIDDAYNSNPAGFTSALKLLSLLKRDGGRRILGTPGMVELGSAHDSEHKIIGKLVASMLMSCCRFFRSALRSSMKATGRQIFRGYPPCANFTAAREWLEINVRKEDVVLMENDLPDLYEKKLRL